MKKILIICVTFHSDKELHAFVESVRRAAERVEGQIQVDIEVADNGINNLGYLGGALAIYNAKAQGYDFVSISNVDLELAPDFFEQLVQLNVSNIGWLAPDIYTDKINRHENPYMLSRPKKRNFFIWNIIYSSTWIYRLYHALYVLKSQKSKVYPSCDIYAGHGSFMLFTKAFVEHYPELHFPAFMYGEEIWLAELTRAAQLGVRYFPTLLINNTGNISTGVINQARKSRWSKESLQAIYTQFFE
ncbi:MAG: hypothetical protein IKM83_05370 [Paludibacteraceae bacterium]|nr:hypothetical protein [Paludibacteraceae bacterium]